jgi:hypothetical protein
MIRRMTVGSGLVAAFAAGVFVGNGPLVRAQAQQVKKRVFEIRTYTAHPGRLDGIIKRMGGGEGKIFERLGMQPMGFFVAAEAPKSADTFVYILAHESREAATASWAKFREDPEWKALQAKSYAESGGPTTAKVDSIFVNPTDFSPMK